MLTAGALLFYLYTLAPTVLWGDDAYFQRTAFLNAMRPDGSAHWLWLQAAQPFVRLSWGDVAFRVNLLSAVAAALTLLFLYLAAREVGLGVVGATAATLSLSVAHTFWLHAVRAEVYTTFTLFLALYLWLMASWRSETKAPLYAAALLFGMALLSHQMALLILPAWLFLLWQRRGWLKQQQWVWLSILGLIGLVPFLIVIQRQIGAVAGVSLPMALRRYFTQAGADFSAAFFDFTLDMLLDDILIWIGLLGLQFFGLAFLLGLWGIAGKLGAQRSALWSALLVLYLTDILFAISYRVSDRYVFFLPGYLVFALFIGAGWENTERFLRTRLRSPRIWSMLGLLLLLLTPVTVYYTLPRLMTLAALDPLAIRSLPERAPYHFFLWPSKRAYWGAADYGWTTLDALQPGALLLADHTPLETMRYLQTVEGVRPDVTLLKIEPGEDLAPLVTGREPTVPVYLADDDPRYYNLRNLPDAVLLPAGPAYRLQLGSTEMR